MSGLLRFVHLLALAVWIGEIAFFSFVAAPAIFAVLGSERAGDVVAVIFPRYYAIGAIAAGVALASGVALARGAEARGAWGAACLAIAVGLAATAWAGGVVQPRARVLRAAMREAGPESAAQGEFRRAHGTAMALNAVALLGAVAGLGLAARALRH